MAMRMKNFDRISKSVQGLEGETRSRMKGAVQESLQDTSQKMKELVAQRGTGKQWKGDWGSWPHGTPGRTSSSPGRVASGRMMDAITFEMSADTKHRVRGRVGWLGRLGDLKYAPMQDQGFTHWITGEKIAGMMALRDAMEYGEEKFVERAEKIARDIVKDF